MTARFLGHGGIRAEEAVLRRKFRFEDIVFTGHIIGALEAS